LKKRQKLTRKKRSVGSHIFFGGTEKDYGNRGIMTALIDESIKMGKKKKIFPYYCRSYRFSDPAYF